MTQRVSAKHCQWQQWAISGIQGAHKNHPNRTRAHHCWWYRVAPASTFHLQWQKWSRTDNLLYLIYINYYPKLPQNGAIDSIFSCEIKKNMWVSPPWPSTSQKVTPTNNLANSRYLIQTSRSNSVTNNYWSLLPTWQVMCQALPRTCSRFMLPDWRELSFIDYYIPSP